MDEDTTYYTFDASQVFTPLNATYYIANKYYFDNIINGETIKSLDKNASMTAGRTYYKKNDFFVEEDKFNLFARGSVWNKGVDVIPASVNLATRRERYGMEELTGFARTLNTIHGLILKVNQLLELEDTETRDRTTFAGTINSLNDILNKFDILEANKFTVVDSYGRIRTGDTVTDSYLSVDISGNVADTKISFAHNLSGVTGSKTITNDSTTIAYGGTFKIPVLSYNEAGHITSVTNESLTLPKNSLVSTGNGNLISDLTFNETTGAFTKTKEYIGELKLTNYSIGTAVSALAASDTLNAALGKLEYKLDKEITDRKALDYTDTEDTTQFVSSVSQEDG
jgi:hypothetical protein